MQLKTFVLFIAMLGVMFASIDLRIDTEKKTEGLLSLSAKMEIEKKAQCFQLAKEMVCYTLVRSSDLDEIKDTPVITASKYSPSKIEYLVEIKRFIKEETNEVCVKYDKEEIECLEYENRTSISYWATFNNADIKTVLSLKKDAWVAIKQTMPKWTNPKDDGTFKFDFQVGQSKADPVVSSCDSTLTGETGTIHTLEADLNCTGNATIIGNHSLVLDCQGHTIEFARITNGYGVYSLNFDNITIKNCNIIQQNSSAGSNGNSGNIYMSTTRNSTITNNTGYITRGRCAAVYITGNCNNNTISYNKLNGSSYGIHLFSPGTTTNQNNKIIHNEVSLTSDTLRYGTILIEGGSSNSVIQYNVVDNNSITVLDNSVGIGLRAVWSHNRYNNITNNRIIGLGKSSQGIKMFGQSSGRVYFNDFNNNTFAQGSTGSDGGYFVFVEAVNFYAHSNLFRNSIVNLTSGLAPFYYPWDTQALNNNTNNTFMNIQYYGQQTNSTYFRTNQITSNNSIIMLNVSGINKTALYFAVETINHSVLYQEYARINVSWLNGTPINGAIVNSTNEQGIWQDFGTTGADGLTEWFVVNDTMYRGAVSNISYALHNFTANATFAKENSTNFTISSTDTITIFLESEYVPPPPPVFLNVSQILPIDAYVTASPVSFSCNAATNETLTAIGIMIWNATDLVVQNETEVSGTFNETSFIQGLDVEWYNWSCYANSTTLVNMTLNRSLQVASDSEDPSVNLVYPDTLITVRSSPYPFTCQFKDDVAVKTGYLIIQDVNTTIIMNQSVNITGIDNTTILYGSNFTSGSYLWWCDVCDWVGKCASGEESERYFISFVNVSGGTTSRTTSVDTGIPLFIVLIMCVMAIAVYFQYLRSNNAAKIPKKASDNGDIVMRKMRP